MSRYIIRRILQAIPLLLIISVILFVLMRNAGDPLATMGGRSVTRPEDRERLSRLLGLDKPLSVQYLYWLIGNDWTTVDRDGDGVAETRGERKGVLRGEFAKVIEAHEVQCAANSANRWSAGASRRGISSGSACPTPSF